jgi:hypothetical protein
MQFANVEVSQFSASSVIQAVDAPFFIKFESSRMDTIVSQHDRRDP